MKEVYNNEELLIRLLNSLLETYRIIVNILKARENITVNDILRILQDKESELKPMDIVAYIKKNGNKY